MEEEKRISEEELKKDVAAAEARIRKTDDFTSPEELYGELISSVKKYHPSDDISLIEKAYRVAADAHKDQKRKSGEPYIIHPLCVAIILADLELDKESIAAGLLHDVVEDTVMTEEELTALIDATIAEVGATSPREMGKVISAIMATHKGRVDGKAVSAAVKARLS